MFGDGFKVHGGFAPAPRLEAIFAKRNPQHELSGHGPVGLDELSVAFLQAAEFFVHLAQAVVQPRGLLGLAAQAAQGLVQAAFGLAPLLFAVIDVRHGDDGGQVSRIQF